MELHRSRGFLYLGAILLLIGVGVLAVTDGFIFQAAGVLFVVGGLLQLYRGLRPFRFVIGPDGLVVRTRYAARELSWSEIRKLTLGPDGILSATVVAPGAADQAVKLLDLSELRESQEQAVAALTADGRDGLLELQVAARTSPGQGFPVVLRGFEAEPVDALVKECESAIAAGDREGAGRAVAAFRATPPVVALRGYDRTQVEDYVSYVEGWVAAAR